MKLILTQTALLFIIYSLVSCGENKENKDYSFKIEKIFSVKDSNILSPCDIEIDLNDNIYILDNISHSVAKYNNTGELVWKVGREGSGPGEFEAPMHLDICGSQVYINDITLNRITIFDLDGNLMKSQNYQTKMMINSDFQVVSEIIFVGGTYFTKSLDGSWFIFSILNEDKISKDLFNKNAISEKRPKPYLKFIMDSQNDFYVYDLNNRHNYIIDKYDNEGNFIKEITRDVQTVRMTEKEKLEVKRKRENSPLAGLMKNRKINDEYKRLTPHIYLDEKDFIYVKTPVKNGWALDVFDSEGNYLLQIPFDINREAVIKNGYIYQVELDEQDVIYSIVKYKLQYEPGNR